MTGIIIRITAVVVTISVLIGILFSFSKKPVFEETDPIIKTEFDEGVFEMKSFDILVSPKGDDNNIGTEDSPLRSFSAAKEMVKKLKDADCGTITVWFKGGTYPVTDEVLFNSDDTTNVIYRSVPGEKVIFSAAKEFSTWQETVVNGVRAFVCDAGGESFNSAYKDGKRLINSVYPKKGTLNVSSVSDEDAFYPEEMYFSLHGAFYADTADISGISDFSDSYVRVLHYWCDEILPVSNVNSADGRIEVKKPSSMRISKDDRYYFENVFEALSEPGEWYLDDESDKLYYIPADGETVDNTTLNVGVNDKFMTIDGCNNIEFRGLDFCNSGWNIVSGGFYQEKIDDSNNPLKNNIEYYANSPQAAIDAVAAIEVQRSTGINFIDCRFNNIGSTAVLFGVQTSDCKAVSCQFDDIGANAVAIIGENNVTDESRQTKSITVSDCDISNYGKVYNNAIGVLLIHAKDCEISHNEIRDGFYTGISVGWVWGYYDNVTDNIQIKNNLIYNIGQGWLSDMGGIYTLGIQENTVISGNVIHDVGCYEGDSGYGGWGIYLDEGSSYITVENNIAYNCSSQGFHQHYGKDNMIRNNIFALNKDGQMRVSRKEEHNSLYFYNNILVSDNSLMYYKPYENQFKDSGNIYWDYTRRQCVFSGTEMTIKHRDSVLDMKLKGYYNDAVFADPMFKDPFNGDFTLAVNSPAIDAGFVPFTVNAGTLTQF